MTDVGDKVNGTLNLDFDDDVPKAVENEAWVKVQVPVDTATISGGE